MFCRVTVVILLLGVQALSGEKVTDENLAKEWLQEFDVGLSQVLSNALFARWNYQVNITTHNAILAAQAMPPLVEYTRVACVNASRFDWTGFSDASVIRQLKGLSVCTHMSNDDIKMLNELLRNMTTIYNSAKVLTRNGTRIPLNPDLTRLTATSRDWDELLFTWEGWHNETGRKLKPYYTPLITLLNNEVRLRGLSDFGVVWRNMYEMDNFSGACEELWQQVKPLYQQLHAYVRRKLKSSYPDNQQNFPSTRQIPAHILGNLWTQDWENILDLVKPFPNSSAIDVTKLLTDKGYNALRMFRESESFFTSLGLPVLPGRFWNHSLIEKPTDGRAVDCHASAHDFRNRRDFRIKQCTDVTGDDFSTTHHEMGHIHYFMAYKDQPVVFQGGANPGFQEAIGDVISLSVMTPKHLRKINLLSDTADDSGSEMNFLMQQALKQVAFLPYGYLIDRWRWEVFNETITAANYNEKFWKLRCGLQGISPPLIRTEDDFDIGALYHIGANAPYMSYFVSYIIQFQFHKSLCEAAGHVGPLHKCDIYNSTVAGNKLRSMLSLGGSKPWPDAMETLTGQRRMDAGPLLEYFRPLKEWLERENKDQDVTWDDDCPSGTVQ